MIGEQKANFSMPPPEPPSLLGPLKLPTTRDVARFRKAHGAGALPDGVRRGGDAAYQEIVCRTALNRVAGMPFAWTLNPYRGCTHGCHYCFARRYHAQLEMGPGDEFSSAILVKVNFPAVLKRELARSPRTHDRMALGTATDPYQPIEGRYRLTRRTLEVLAGRPAPISLVTKGPLVVRDADLLAELGRRTACTVNVSVPTVDDDAWRRLEPGTAQPLQRLRAVRTLVEAGVDAGVLMAPIVPGISSHPAKLEATVRAAADHGAAFVGAGLLHLEDGTRAHFLEFLAREYPDLVEGYGRLYAGKYAAPPYADRVRTVLGVLKARYGVARRDPAPDPGDAPAHGGTARPDQAPWRQPTFLTARAKPAGGAPRSAARSADGC